MSDAGSLAPFRFHALAVLFVLVGSMALAGDSDPRGWSIGTAAANAVTMSAGPSERPILALPASLRREIRGTTLVFYFSPTCPHCRHVGPEIAALHSALATQNARVVGVASGSATRASMTEFNTAYGIDFPVVHDESREIVSAIGARSTPSALLVRPKGKGQVDVMDAWYPYRPGTEALVRGRVAQNMLSPASTGAYLGNTYCGACHTEEHASWSLTHHAVAWQTLRRLDRTDAEECTGCHVTGAGQPGGWAGDPHDRLVDVGCEACHGPSGPHDGTATAPESTCAQCHDAKHSIAFSYDKGLPLLDHYRINDLSDAEVAERRQALWRGEAPRELLAFADGKNVGSAACQRCHVQEYDWWAEHRHSRAMSTLRKEGHDDPTCVRCHATPRHTGATSAVSDFRTLEGVGCESCHGPGEAHVSAEGGTDNIEGLGEDCPVCVIEAVCTGCHTEQRDPEWDLDTRLRQVRHGPSPSVD